MGFGSGIGQRGGVGVELTKGLAQDNGDRVATFNDLVFGIMGILIRASTRPISSGTPALSEPAIRRSFTE